MLILHIIDDCLNLGNKLVRVTILSGSAIVGMIAIGRVEHFPLGYHCVKRQLSGFLQPILRYHSMSQSGRSDSVIMLICSPNTRNPIGAQDTVTI